jgi:putative ABC transport system substrate-binding protein
MKRRNFIIILGGAAVAQPACLLAQTSSTVYRVGLLNGGGLSAGPFEGALMRGLAQHGYVPNQNLALERRGAEGHADRLPRLVAELAASKVRVIIALGYLPAVTAKTDTPLPVVVFSAGDPVATGLADSLARPGGHVTGISDVSAQVTPKFAPGLRRVAMLWNADDLAMTLRYKAAQARSPGAGHHRPAIGRARACRFRPRVRGNESRHAGRDPDGLRPAYKSQPKAGFRIRRGASSAGHL